LPDEVKIPNNICESCGRKISAKDLYVIYKVIVVSKDECTVINMPTLVNELNDWVTENCYHLSATQIILLRPDLLKVFLNKKFYPDEVQFWYLCDTEICNACYSHYVQLVPER
jgi:hypothetical protein